MTRPSVPCSWLCHHIWVCCVSYPEAYRLPSSGSRHSSPSRWLDPVLLTLGGAIILECVVWATLKPIAYHHLAQDIHLPHDDSTQCSLLLVVPSYLSVLCELPWSLSLTSTQCSFLLVVPSYLSVLCELPWSLSLTIIWLKTFISLTMTRHVLVSGNPTISFPAITFTTLFITHSQDSRGRHSSTRSGRWLSSKHRNTFCHRPLHWSSRYPTVGYVPTK